jgi:sporulation protein YlmC with PRC-barrel domain
MNTIQPDPLHIDFHLLDRQIVDRDGMMIGNVDDVELQPGDDGELRVVALLVGQHVLGERVGGVIGRLLTATARRLSSAENLQPLRIPYDLVAEVGSEIRLSIRGELLTELPLEAWLREHLIDRIPGADVEGQ